MVIILARQRAAFTKGKWPGLSWPGLSLAKLITHSYTAGLAGSSNVYVWPESNGKFSNGVGGLLFMRFSFDLFIINYTPHANW